MIALLLVLAGSGALAAVPPAIVENVNRDGQGGVVFSSPIADENAPVPQVANLLCAADDDISLSINGLLSCDDNATRVLGASTGDCADLLQDGCAIGVQATPTAGDFDEFIPYLPSGTNAFGFVRVPSAANADFLDGNLTAGSLLNKFIGENVTENFVSGASDTRFDIFVPQGTSPGADLMFLVGGESVQIQLRDYSGQANGTDISIRQNQDYVVSVDFCSDGTADAAPVLSLLVSDPQGDLAQAHAIQFDVSDTISPAAVSVSGIPFDPNSVNVNADEAICGTISVRMPHYQLFRHIGVRTLTLTIDNSAGTPADIFLSPIRVEVEARVPSIGSLDSNGVVQPDPDCTEVFINEVNYRDVLADGIVMGGDGVANEMVEIAGPVGTDLTTFSVQLIDFDELDGPTGGVYVDVQFNTDLNDDIDGIAAVQAQIRPETTGDPDGLFGVFVVRFPEDGIQNGDGVQGIDAVRLLDGGVPVHTVCFGPNITTTDVGIAANIEDQECDTFVSVQGGVLDDTTDAGSIQAFGCGQCLEHFDFAEIPASGTFGGTGTGGGEINTNQQFCGDRDLDGFWDGVGQAEGFGGAGLELTSVGLACCGGNDCHDFYAHIHPGAEEICDGFDTDCNDAGYVDDGVTISVGSNILTPTTITPLATAATGGVDGEVDEDGDGRLVCDGDCNDDPAAAGNLTFGAALLVVGNTIPDRTNGVPDLLVDSPAGVAQGNPAFPDITFLFPDGAVSPDDDLDDDDVIASGGQAAVELCDNVDNDCNVVVDDNFGQRFHFEDFDNDGFAGVGALSNISTTQSFPNCMQVEITKDENGNPSCSTIFPRGWSQVRDDCDDNAGDGAFSRPPGFAAALIQDQFGNVVQDLNNVLPNAERSDFADTDCDYVEFCDNLLDENCNGLVDENLFIDVDGDLFSSKNETSCRSGDQPAGRPGPGYLIEQIGTDCVDTDEELAVVVARIISERSFADGAVVTLNDTLSAADPALARRETEIANILALNINASNINPGSISGSVFTARGDTCDGYDNDCSGVVDDGTNAFVDADEDQFSDVDESGECVDAYGAAFVNTDCNITDPNINPAEQEIPCNIFDDDCSDSVNFGQNAAIFDAFRVDGGLADSTADIGTDLEFLCDGIDNDCDGTIDEGYVTNDDGDAFFRFVDGISEPNCTIQDELGNDVFPDIYLATDGTTLFGDCNDQEVYTFSPDGGTTTFARFGNATFPGAPEVCDGVDNNCANGTEFGRVDLLSTDAATGLPFTADELFFVDNDPVGTIADDDGDVGDGRFVFNGTFGVDDSVTFGEDVGDLASLACFAFNGLNIDDNGDCNDGNSTLQQYSVGFSADAVETFEKDSCDNIDNNCNGQTDEGLFIDNDGDGFPGNAAAVNTTNGNPVCTGRTYLRTNGRVLEGDFDCVDDQSDPILSDVDINGVSFTFDTLARNIHPGSPLIPAATEVPCDNVDNDCNGLGDFDFTNNVFDRDGDLTFAVNASAPAECTTRVTDQGELIDCDDDTADKRPCFENEIVDGICQRELLEGFRGDGFGDNIDNDCNEKVDDVIRDAVEFTLTGEKVEVTSTIGDDDDDRKRSASTSDSSRDDDDDDCTNMVIAVTLSVKSKDDECNRATNVITKGQLELPPRAKVAQKVFGELSKFGVDINTNSLRVVWVQFDLEESQQINIPLCLRRASDANDVALTLTVERADELIVGGPATLEIR